MRLTIESTDSGPYAAPRSVSIEVSGDDWDFSTVVTDLIEPALHGWGYSPDTIMGYSHPEDYTDGDDA